jgi:glycosyltransferase involved in cell wall biosynthesis
MELQKRFRFELTVDLPDLRNEVQRCQIVVLPFVSGGGIKNKLLEAAAMGMPIVASSKALNGISSGQCPIFKVNSVSQWLSRIEQLWADDQFCIVSGQSNRDWVTEQCTWQVAARIAQAGLLSSGS